MFLPFFCTSQLKQTMEGNPTINCKVTRIDNRARIRADRNGYYADRFSFGADRDECCDDEMGTARTDLHLARIAMSVARIHVPLRSPRSCMYCSDCNEHNDYSF